MTWHLLQYFAAEMGLTVPGLPSLRIRKPARPAWIPEGRYATAQTRAGWSRYKEWPHFPSVFAHEDVADIPIIGIGEEECRTLAESIAIIANSSLHIGIDSFANHLTNYTWIDRAQESRVPGVILFGSTQASASGYPRNTNISLGLHCQPCFRETHPNSRHPRGPCINVAADGVHRCMSEITVERVVAAVVKAWPRAH